MKNLYETLAKSVVDAAGNNLSMGNMNKIENYLADINDIDNDAITRIFEIDDKDGIKTYKLVVLAISDWISDRLNEMSVSGKSNVKVRTVLRSIFNKNWSGEDEVVKKVSKSPKITNIPINRSDIISIVNDVRKKWNKVCTDVLKLPWNIKESLLSKNISQEIGRDAAVRALADELFRDMDVKWEYKNNELIINRFFSAFRLDEGTSMLFEQAGIDTVTSKGDQMTVYYMGEHIPLTLNGIKVYINPVTSAPIENLTINAEQKVSFGTSLDNDTIYRLGKNIDVTAPDIEFRGVKDIKFNKAKLNGNIRLSLAREITRYLKSNLKKLGFFDELEWSAGHLIKKNVNPQRLFDLEFDYMWMWWHPDGRDRAKIFEIKKDPSPATFKYTKGMYGSITRG